MKINDLLQENVAVLGLSVEGISAGNFLFRHKIPFTVLEKKTMLELGKRFENLEKWNCRYRLGENHLDNAGDYSLLLRSPGIPLFLPQLKAAKLHGAKISSNTKLFMDLCQGITVGVTGTKGKGTTVMLISEILKNTDKKYFIGGNIGVPPLDFIEQVDSKTIVVLELSSFQLEDFEKSPHIGVVLGLAPDHLAPESSAAPNFHPNAPAYYRIKERLVSFQDNNDFAILNFDDPIVRDFSKKTLAKISYFSTGDSVVGAYVKNGERIEFNDGHQNQFIGDVSRLRLAGRHNWWNVCAAICVAETLHCPSQSIINGVFSFKGYEHRLELVRELECVKYYDDSAATNPEPSIAAIKAFKEPIIFIAGGSDKGQDYSELGTVIAQSSVKLVYLIGNMADKIKFAIEKTDKYHKQIISAGYPQMETIVKDCHARADKGDVVLFSPACASFDMFENYKDRGNRFKTAVNKLDSEE